LLTRQLDDLGRQIQALLKELTRARDPMLPTEEELEADTSTVPATNIDEVITNQLVLFRSLGALQERNQQLLQLVRRLGDQMETEERDYKVEMEREQTEAIREAHDAIQELQGRLESEKKANEIRVQSLVKERDSLKTLLERAQRGAYVNGNGNTEPAASEPELQKELAEIQNQFDAYKTEMGVDASRLRQEALDAQRENAQLNASLAKANANVEFLSGELHTFALRDAHAETDCSARQKSDQERYGTQTRELDSLSKRNTQLYEQYTRVDVQLTHVEDELSQAKSRLEQMRYENANMRAEKQMLEVRHSASMSLIYD
jgi:nucleoprotein TPR